MGAELLAMSVALKKDQDVNVDGARAALLNIIKIEKSDLTLGKAAEWVGLPVPDALTRAVLQADNAARERWKDSIYQAYLPKLEQFEASLTNRDVAMHQHGGIKIFFTAGLSHGEAPTDSYEIWVGLLEDGDPEYGNPFYDEIFRGYGFLTIN